MSKFVTLDGNMVNAQSVRAASYEETTRYTGPGKPSEPTHTVKVCMKGKDYTFHFASESRARKFINMMSEAVFAKGYEP